MVLLGLKFAQVVLLDLLKFLEQSCIIKLYLFSTPRLEVALLVA